MNSEQIILSILLNEPDLLPMANIQVGNFQAEKHRDIFHAMQELDEYDLVTISQQTGHAQYLSKIYSNFVLGSINEKTLNLHCQKVKETYNRNALHNMARNILSSDDPVSQIIAESEVVISNLDSGVTMESNKETLSRVFKKMEERVRSKDGIIGTRLGFQKLDNLLGGLDGGRFVIIGGRPKQGKSAFVGNIVENLTIKNDEPCVVYTFEMSKEVWMERFVFSVSNVRQVETGKNRWTFHQDEYSKMFNSTEKIIAAPITVVEAAGMHLNDLAMSIQTYHNKHGVKNFFVDYIQRVRYAEEEYKTITETSMKLSELTQKLKCNIFGVAQLNRESVSGGSVKRPTMKDLRGSGQLEQDADAIIFVHRPKAYKEDGDDAIILDANRHGQPGDIRMKFNGFNFQWSEI